MSATERIDGTIVVTTYFEDRITAAQKEVEAARAALAAAEATVAQRQTERDAFLRDGSLHPAAYDSDTGQPEWELCQWAIGLPSSRGLSKPLGSQRSTSPKDRCETVAKLVARPFSWV
ncbi:hypothetical protein ACWDG9_16995 [Streptomyces sp. NPDC001073]